MENHRKDESKSLWYREHHGFAVCIDSVSLLIALDNADLEEQLLKRVIVLCHKLQCQGLQFIFTWSLSHIRTKVNKQADCVARIATDVLEADIVPITLDDLTIVAKSTIIASWQQTSQTLRTKL